MSRAAIVGGAEFNARHFTSCPFDHVIAADAGYRVLRAVGRVPDAAVGDFDSLGFVPDDCRSVVVPERKDESDLALAAHEAWKLDCDTLLFYGCLSERLDHTWAALAEMVAAAARGARVFGIGGDFAVAVLDADHPQLSFSADALSRCTDGSTDDDAFTNLSVFAFGAGAEGVTIRGMVYTLDRVHLDPATSRGLSNEFTDEAASVSLESGVLLVFFPLSVWPTLVDRP